MKSKSFYNVQKKMLDKDKPNKTLDFAGYYKSSEESNIVLEQSNSTDNVNKENKFKSKIHTPKRECTPKNKIKHEPLDISHIDIVGPGLDTSIPRSTPLNESKVTSTPQLPNKSKQTRNVKSIMKNSSSQSEDHMDDSQFVATPSKPKKRNKSVSFMLDENEEVVVKKTKSNDSISQQPGSVVDTRSKDKMKKNRKPKKVLSGKENKIDTNVDIKTKPSGITHAIEDKTLPTDTDSGKKINLHKKRKIKKLKKQNSQDVPEVVGEDTKEEQSVEAKKKKKKLPKLNPALETEADGEPTAKASKKEVKAEAIVENLESLSIGDNAHTLSNLLDEMTVAEKDKRKKTKRKLKKDKNPEPSASSSDNAENPTGEESKEKVKWQKRKWNKDKKGDLSEDNNATTLLIDNLPLSIMFSYKKLLNDHFNKYGIIKNIGVAEVYSTDQANPVFTTTINFYSDGAATQALEEDNVTLEGSRIRVRRPPPPTLTTLVVRGFADLSDQALSSAFLPAGNIRTIRHLVKGKKSNATAFIEFDGPEALDRALQLAKDLKIGGKKVHAAKFELRAKKRKISAASDGELPSN